MKHLIILVALACALAYVGTSQAECCLESMTIKYFVHEGCCAAVGGQEAVNEYGCTITICADGKAKIDDFCGRGTCDISGCDCLGGCLRGDYLQSFLENNEDHLIVVVGEKMNNGKESIEEI